MCVPTRLVCSLVQERSLQGPLGRGRWASPEAGLRLGGSWMPLPPQPLPPGDTLWSHLPVASSLPQKLNGC